MNRKRSHPAFLNGVPELLVLHLVSDRPMYGYQIVQALKMAANRQFDFGEGCIYPILHRLEVQEYLQSRRETVAGRSRVVYRITAKGKKQLGDSVTCWQRVVQAVSHVLQGGKHEQPALA